MSTEGHYSYESQMERANLIRQRLGWRSLNGWFRGLKTPARDLWHNTFAEDPLTGRQFQFGSKEYHQANLIYPVPVARSQMPRAPIDFTAAAPSTPSPRPEKEEPPWKKAKAGKQPEKEPEQPPFPWIRSETSGFSRRGSAKNQTASTTGSTSIRHFQGSIRS